MPLAYLRGMQSSALDDDAVRLARGGAPAPAPAACLSDAQDHRTVLKDRFTHNFHQGTFLRGRTLPGSTAVGWGSTIVGQGSADVCQGTRVMGQVRVFLAVKGRPVRYPRHRVNRLPYCVLQLTPYPGLLPRYAAKEQEAAKETARQLVEQQKAPPYP